MVGLRTPLSPGDIAFMIEEVFRGRSVITGIATRLVLVRWRRPATDPLMVIEGAPDEDGPQKSAPAPQKSTRLRLSDLVCMTKDEAMVHLREVLLGGKQPEEMYDAETVERVNMRLSEAAGYEKFR